MGFLGCFLAFKDAGFWRLFVIRFDGIAISNGLTLCLSQQRIALPEVGFNEIDFPIKQRGVSRIDFPYVNTLRDIALSTVGFQLFHFP